MLICSVLFLIIFFSVHFVNGKDVLQYTDDNFSVDILQHETALVMFYAPWCGHCKKLKPEFFKAAKELLKTDPPIRLVKVDCTESGKSTCNNYKVSGYPALKVFKYGLPQDYSGPRDASGIIKYMRMQSEPSSKEFSDLSTLESFLASETGSTIIGFFNEDSELMEIFLEAANNLREKLQFGHTSQKDVLEKYEASDDIILFRPAHLHNKFESDSVKYSGNASVEEIETFILSNNHGLVGHRMDTNREDFNIPNVVAYYQVDYKRNPKGTNYWRNRILKVAQQYKDKLTFAVSHFNELKEFGQISFTEKPIVLAKDSNNEKYKMEDEFSIEMFENFVQNFLANKLEPYAKSEDIPEVNDQPVKIVVGRNFKDIVMENGRDTLIVFHSPRCGHCKKLMPVYELLADNLKDEDVVFAKIDATANDVPSLFKINGYPTIYWLSKNDKNSPVAYEGGRKMQDFIKYIAEHATDELMAYDRNGNLKQKDEL